MCLGIPGQIVALPEGQGDVATVQLSGAERAVDISLVRADGVAAGDWVLVHAGFALSTLSEREASETLDLLREIGESYSAELALAATGGAET